MWDETTEQQATLTGLLFHHALAPVAGDRYLRGVLPAPPPAHAIRLATGPPVASQAPDLTLYEFPLTTGGEPVTADHVTGVLRTLLTGPHVDPQESLSAELPHVPVIRVDLAAVEPTPEPVEERALTIMRTLVHPYTGEFPDPLMVGFLLPTPDLLRLYLAADDIDGIVAVDVRPSGAVTALTAALPSLVTETERMRKDDVDPHCTWAMDLTDW
ncbi:hypothetical protein GCM10017752_12720 [Streptomyces roseoviridis]